METNSKIQRENINRFVDRTYNIRPKPVMVKGKWIEQEEMYLVFPKPHYEKKFHEQEWTEKITKDEWQKRLKDCVGELK